MSEPDQILFVGPNPELSFVQKDLELLGSRYRVVCVWRRDHATRREITDTVRRHLATREFSLLFVWFAEPYDTFSIVLEGLRHQVRSAVVVGGYEVTYLPEIDYGGLKRFRDRLRTRWALQLASAVLPTSGLLGREVVALGRKRAVEVIPLGIDCNFFSPGGGPKERLVVTVSSISARTEKLKGLDALVKISRRLPDVAFSILGPTLDAATEARLKGEAGPNLQIEGRFLLPAELREWYQRATVYAQLSARESFGAALAEAMACCCRPVVTNCGALPEVVGDVGGYVDYGDWETAAMRIQMATDIGPSLAARERIRTLFSAERRATRLLAVVEDLIRGAKQKPRSGRG